jgi:hypothetical protein
VGDGEKIHPRENCAIFLETIEQSSIVPNFHCSHSFHKNCILGWANSVQDNSFRCPICVWELHPKEESTDSGSKTPPRDTNQNALFRQDIGKARDFKKLDGVFNQICNGGGFIFMRNPCNSE